jgi:protein gp37
MNTSVIQWADSTVSPVAGCDGCELWPSAGRLRNVLIDFLADHFPGQAAVELRQVVTKFIPAELTETLAYKARKEIVTGILGALEATPTPALIDLGVKAISQGFRCYAGQLTLRYCGRTKGYPELFEKPVPFPGHMAKAAAASDLTGTNRPKKPWLNGLPRLISVSDMGDALSTAVPFDFLKFEIIDVVASPNGQRHIWVWLTKHPCRMARFSQWLWEQGGNWPENLVAMTSVTSEKTLSRADQLTRLDAPLKGLVVEPLCGPMELPLRGISWVIVGGETGPQARPFHLRWLHDIQSQCEQPGVPLFVNGLGSDPRGTGWGLKLRDRQGSDWSDWPVDLRIREFPAAFDRRNLMLSRGEAALQVGPYCGKKALSPWWPSEVA